MDFQERMESQRANPADKFWCDSRHKRKLEASCVKTLVLKL